MLDDFFIPEFDTMMSSVNTDDLFLSQLFDYYHRQLVANSRVHKELIDLGLPGTVIVSSKLGYCDRTLNRYIQRAVTSEGAAFRGCLQRLELVKATGHELFRGCVVEPVFNDEGEIISACGVKLGKRVRRNAPTAIFWYRQGVYTELMGFKLMELGGQYVS